MTLLTMFCGYITNVFAQVKTTDSIFIKDSRPIQFIADKIQISEADKQWITEKLIPQLKELGDRGIIIGRATASPEGPLPNNIRLAKGRRASVDALLSSYGINSGRIRYDVVAEDYPLLLALMKHEGDRQYHATDSLMKHYGDDTQKLKAALKSFDEGRLWQRILHRYFPLLRAVRIMAIDKSLVDVAPVVPIQSVTINPIGTTMSPRELHIPMPTGEPLCGQQREPRREFMSIKTNVLFDFAYMPGYDRFCPIPNVALEYYPKHGHFTYGASFDGPWWQHYDEHKYFQLRNYQLHTRYYLRSGDINKRHPSEGAAFKGLFFSAYAHAFIYNICFGEKRGWEGEGYGAGLGIGYVLPLGRSEHWRLEFGLQAGFFNTPYDPYQWRCPINPDSDPEQYYYKWYGDAKNFKKRQHRYTWLGPTRLEITLSYDILYRRNNKKGVSFRNHEAAARY
mgnify:FL=1